MLGYQRGEIQACVKRLDGYTAEALMVTQRLELPNLSSENKRRFKAELNIIETAMEHERYVEEDRRRRR